MQQAVTYNAVHDWQTHQKAPEEPAKARPAPTDTGAPPRPELDTRPHPPMRDPAATYTAASAAPSGTYPGAYQFDTATWHAMGRQPATPPSQHPLLSKTPEPEQPSPQPSAAPPPRPVSRPMTDSQPPVAPIEHTATPLTDEEWIAYAEGKRLSDPAHRRKRDDGVTDFQPPVDHESGPLHRRRRLRHHGPPPRPVRRPRPHQPPFLAFAPTSPPTTPTNTRAR